MQERYQEEITNEIAQLMLQDKYEEGFAYYLITSVEENLVSGFSLTDDRTIEFDLEELLSVSNEETEEPVNILNSTFNLLQNKDVSYRIANRALYLICAVGIVLVFIIVFTMLKYKMM